MPDQTLAQRVRAKYPGVYDDLSDQQLEAKVSAKFPGAYDDVPRTPVSAGDAGMTGAMVTDTHTGTTTFVEGEDADTPRKGLEAAVRTLWDSVAGFIPGTAASKRLGQAIASGEFFKSIPREMALEAFRADKARQHGDYLTAARHLLASVIPGLGPALSRQADKLRAGKVWEAGGEMAGTALSFAAPGGAAKAVGAVRRVPARVAGTLGSLNPVEADAVRFGMAEGVPLDLATASGSRAVRRLQEVSDSTIANTLARTGERSAVQQGEAMTSLGRRLASRANAAEKGQTGRPMTPETGGQGLTDRVAQTVKEQHGKASQAYDRLRAIEERPENQVEVVVQPKKAAGEKPATLPDAVTPSRGAGDNSTPQNPPKPEGGTRTYQTGVPFEADLWHGSPSRFHKFEAERLGSNTGAEDARAGFHFASSEEGGTLFAGLEGEQAGTFERGHVMPFRVKAKNPLVIGLTPDESGLPKAVLDAIGDDKQAAIAYAREHGHDAIVYPHGGPVDEPGTVIAFSPDQITRVHGKNLSPDTPWLQYERAEVRVRPDGKIEMKMRGPVDDFTLRSIKGRYVRGKGGVWLSRSTGNGSPIARRLQLEEVLFGKRRPEPSGSPSVGEPSSVPSPASTSTPPASPPQTIRMALPVDMRGIKQALEPVLQRWLQTMPQTQREASPGLLAVRNIVEGPDHVPASVADANLSMLKGLSRGAATPELRDVSQGLAAGAVKQLHAAIDAAVSKAGPEALAALHEGRAATVAKYRAGKVLESLGGGREPVQAFARATMARDAGIARLREVARIAPQELRDVGRAYLDDLIDIATKEGGFGRAKGLQAKWQTLGPETKKLLFGSEAYIEDLDRFFLLAKRMEAMANPSGTSHVATVGATSALVFTHPVAGLVVNGGSMVLSRLLHSPQATRLLVRGLSAGPKSVTATVTARQLAALMARSPALPAGALAAKYPAADRRASGSGETQR